MSSQSDGASGNSAAFSQQLASSFHTANNAPASLFMRPTAQPFPIPDLESRKAPPPFPVQVTVDAINNSADLIPTNVTSTEMTAADADVARFIPFVHSAERGGRNSQDNLPLASALIASPGVLKKLRAALQPLNAVATGVPEHARLRWLGLLELVDEFFGALDAVRAAPALTQFDDGTIAAQRADAVLALATAVRNWLHMLAMLFSWTPQKLNQCLHSFELPRGCFSPQPSSATNQAGGGKAPTGGAGGKSSQTSTSRGGRNRKQKGGGGGAASAPTPPG